MPVKIVRALRQKEATTTEHFQRLWREKIGPHIASLQTSFSLTKYVQIHRSKGASDDSLRASRPNLMREVTPFDIVEELFFEGTVEKFMATYHSDSGSRAWNQLRKFEQPYLDLSLSHIYVTEERPFVLPGSPDNLVASEFNEVVKVVAFAEVTNGSTSVEYWGRSHAALTQQWAPALGLIKYVQNHPCSPAVLEDLARDSGMVKAPYDICAIMYFNGRQSGDNDTYVRAMAEIRKDEDSGFMRPNSMTCFAGKEHIFVDKLRM